MAQNYRGLPDSGNDFYVGITRPGHGSATKRGSAQSGHQPGGRTDFVDRDPGPGRQPPVDAIKRRGPVPAGDRVPRGSGRQAPRDPARRREPGERHPDGKFRSRGQNYSGHVSRPPLPHVPGDSARGERAGHVSPEHPPRSQRRPGQERPRPEEEAPATTYQPPPPEPERESGPIAGIREKLFPSSPPPPRPSRAPLR